VNTDLNIADVVVHLRLESSCDDCAKTKRGLRNHAGEVSVHFSEQQHPHAMAVACNPAVVDAQTLLADIRTRDGKAVMASFQG
jgi:hypothetical protein